MPTIALGKHEWNFDESQRLGPPGGFGEVFRGSGPSGDVAVKRLKLTAGAAAHREMKIGESLVDREYRHVVPVYDYGQDANGDGYYLVMPICERSLQDHLRDNGPLPWSEAKPIILDIIAGLKEVENIVHRDLKPGNVLYRDGRWQIADFGIAKFVEDSTSLETLRHSLTPPYAAPEQWLGERPSGGTDVYALGCIIHTLLTGAPPFGGDINDVREAHLQKPPPQVLGIDPRLGGLVNHMLRKAQAVRPSLDRVQALILATNDALPAAGPRASLAAAGQAVARAAATDEAELVAAQTAAKEWKAIGDDGARDFAGILNRLKAIIVADAPNASTGIRELALGPAKLRWDVPTRLERRVPTRPGLPTEGIWEVAAFSKLEVACSITKVSYHDPSVYTFSTTLAFARTPQDTDFRWREVAFYHQFSGAGMNEAPVAIPPSSESFHTAFQPVIGGLAVAHGPFTIDAEDEDTFIDRWTGLFAKAAHGNLRPPNQLPLGPQFFA
ncbi:serine/threonine-protein kinase [Sphingomonas faeni]|uniref:serine/threonine-protein kinase n=1 Tax=Sphingomonas faeni TaxID=185950 RepID=UPI0020BFE562|nr:serine/threonine-protein kinase [Sphingomonas faeni]MCK8457886.1 serine/threonine protein kinase [Sphingomonas faeni]